MNRRQKHKLASFIAAEALLQAHPEIANVPGLPERLEMLSAKVGEISSLAIKQTRPVEASTLGRDQRLREMVNLTLNLAGIIQTMARAQNLEELGRIVRVGPGVFRRLGAFDRVWLAQRIHDAGQTVLSQLAQYGVTAETLGTLQTRIDAAEEALQHPRVSVATRRGATQQLASMVREVGGLLREEIDRLVFPLRETQPEFYAAYRASRSTVGLPTGGSGAREEPSTPASAAVVTPIAPASPSDTVEQQAA